MFSTIDTYTNTGSSSRSRDSSSGKNAHDGKDWSKQKGVPAIH